ncbi:MAG: hypothetical protein RL060_703 [Bacteroidota bacterium]|jgi:hypothetical protein
MKNKFTCLTFAFSCLVFSVIAQGSKKEIPKTTKNEEPKILRKEIELDRKSDEFFVVPVGKEGIIVFNETKEKTAKGERAWSFKKLNTNLEESWVKSISIGKNLDYEKFYQDGLYTYILLVDGSSLKGAMASAFSGDFTIVKVDPIEGKITTASGEIPFNTTIADFKVTDDVAFFGGETMPTLNQVCVRTCLLQLTCMIPVCFGGGEYKRDATLVTFNLKNAKQTIPSQNYKGSSFTTGLAIDTSNNTVLTVIGNKIDKKTTKTYLKEYSPNGELKRAIEVNPNGNNELIDASICKISDEEKLLIGTYSEPLAKQSFMMKVAQAMAPTTSSYAEGVYISKFVSDKQKFMKYYSFNDFKNFYGYLGKDMENKIEKKIKKQKAKGKTVDVNYALLVHDIIVYNDQYIFLAEAYYKEYHTEYYTDAQGKQRSRRVFDGYRYTHAVVAGMDKEGKMLWDNCFPIWNILTMELKERVKVVVKNSKVVLVYNYGGDLTSKIIDGNKLENYNSIAIETNYDGDKVKENSGSDMFYWYDDYFLAFGYQKIKNKKTDVDNDGDKDIKKKRNVLYMNKIIFK